MTMRSIEQCAMLVLVDPECAFSKEERIALYEAVGDGSDVTDSTRPFYRDFDVRRRRELLVLLSPTDRVAAKMMGLME